ncbi:MAG: DUF924 domain-containing protein [Erythrobacter sp.]|nr:DUF924 domain-containing protein [Erythrobacter sp.]
MAVTVRPWAAELLYVWFRKLGPSDWFRGSNRVDAMLAQRFAHEWYALRHRPAKEFLASSDLARAAVLLFDQVPRNMFRDDPRAFASDSLAQEICRHSLDKGWHCSLSAQQVQFLAMPLMHSEDLGDQSRCVALFARHVPGALSFARNHHRMIARFGRFPHRNEVLGRETTPAEKRAIDAGFTW